MTDHRPWLIFGGSFDPPHRAHVTMARCAMGAISAVQLVLVPAGRSPHKRIAPQASAHHRRHMLDLAFAGVDGVEVSGVELDRPGPSFFVDTLRAIRHRVDPASPVRFLIGADQALAFDRWRAHETILALAEPLVVRRPPWTAERFLAALVEQYGSKIAAHWEAWTIDAPLDDASATEVRARLAAGERASDLGSLLAPDVAAYIERHGLYRAPVAAPRRS